MHPWRVQVCNLNPEIYLDYDTMFDYRWNQLYKMSCGCTKREGNYDLQRDTLRSLSQNIISFSDAAAYF